MLSGFSSSSGLSKPTVIGDRSRSVSACAKRGRRNKLKDSEKRPKPQRITRETAQEVGGVRRYIKLVRKKEKEERDKKIIGGGKSFRRSKRTPEEIAAEKHALKLTGKGKPSLTFASIYNTKDIPKPPMIVIDGYNLMYKLMDNEPHRYHGISLELKRSRFEMDLLAYSRYNSVRLTVAYDAAGYLGDDFSQGLNSCRSAKDVDTFYCFDCDADSGILIEVDRLIVEGHRQILVISSDNNVKLGAYKPPQVFVKSSEMFLEEMLTNRAGVNMMMKEHNKLPADDGLVSTLSQGTWQELSTIRDALAEKKRKEEAAEAKKVKQLKEEKEKEKEREKEKGEEGERKHFLSGPTPRETLKVESPLSGQIDPKTLSRIMQLKKKKKGH